MNVTAFLEELSNLEQVAITALGYIPTRSFYRSWAKQLVGKELKAHKYPKLKNRLTRFVLKNKDLNLTL